MQKGYISLEGKEKIGSEAVSKAIDTAAPLVEAIKDKDLPKEAALLGITTKGKSNIALRSQITAIVAGQIAETASGGSGGGMLKLPGDTTTTTTTTPPKSINIGDTTKKAISGDPTAIKDLESFYNAHGTNSKDPLYMVAIEANRAYTASKQPSNKSVEAPGLLSRGATAVSNFASRNVDNVPKSTTETPAWKSIKLDELTRRRYGMDKSFEDLADSQKKVVLRAFEEKQN